MDKVKNKIRRGPPERTALDLLCPPVYIMHLWKDSSKMFELLRSHILKRIDLSDEEIELTRACFVPKKVRKGQFLSHAGDPSRYAAFVEKGCLRLYSIDEKGEEHVVQFAVEDWWITDMYSFLTGTPATYYIDALEDTEVLLLERITQEKLCTDLPQFERFFRLLYQGNIIAKERRILAALSLSAEEQYLSLIETYPTISQRVPLNQIASYLGITPQSLSRIRKELVEKKH
jgi:CRP-like cAMP-binding protein